MTRTSFLWGSQQENRDGCLRFFSIPVPCLCHALLPWPLLQRAAQAAAAVGTLGSSVAGRAHLFTRAACSCSASSLPSVSWLILRASSSTWLCVGEACTVS